MTVQQFLLALRYRWRTGLAVFTAVLLTVVVLTSVLIPIQYRASSEILVDEENLDRIGGGALQGSTTAGGMPTQVDVVRSERVMLRALRTMGLHEDRGLRDSWTSQAKGQGNFEAWLVERLQARTDVRPTRDSKVLYVSHSAQDPDFAARFVNALVDAYIQTALELRVERARQYNSFFDERARQLREQLHQAQQRSSEFYRVNGITTADEKADVEEARLSQLSTQVVEMQAKAEEARRRQREAAANPDRMEEVLKDPVVVSLATALSVQEQRHNELTERLGDAHPQVIESLSTIAGLRARLQASKRRAAVGFEGGSSVFASQLAESTRALEAQREKVLQRKGIREQARLLQNEVDAAQRALDTVVGRLNKTALERSDTQPNVAVLKVASVPSLPTSSSTAAKVSAGAVVGLLLTLVWIVTLELFDRRLRNADDVRSTLKQPVLTVLHRRRRRKAPSPVRQRLIQHRPAFTNE